VTLTVTEQTWGWTVRDITKFSENQIHDSQETSADDLSSSILVDDSDGDTLVGSETNSKPRTTRPGTICYGGIDLFLLRNPDNPERSILMAGSFLPEDDSG
jgi:hypothetical protein